MRNPARIKPFCDRLAELWEQNCPNWRLGQLLKNVERTCPSGDLFFIEDDSLLALLNDLTHSSQAEG